MPGPLLWTGGFIVVVTFLLLRRRAPNRTSDGKQQGSHPDRHDVRLQPDSAPASRVAADPFSQLEYKGWQRVAGRYQDTWAGLTTRFIPALLDAAGVGRGTRVLDVCCGPAFVAEAAVERGARATAVDFSPEMVNIARARCPELDVRQGDAQALPFESGAFDAVINNFGLLHLPRAEQAFAEAARVLRPGGTYAFTVWGNADVSAGAKILDEALRAHADLSVPVAKGPDHLRHGRIEDWRRILGDAGFDPASTSIALVRAEWEMPTDFFLFEVQRHAGVRTAALLEAQTPDALAAIERHMTGAVREFRTADGYAVPYAAYVVSARSASPGQGTPLG